MMKPKILIVEDDKKTVELVKLYLENEGYEVHAAYDGRMALQENQNFSPHLIILDLMLPKIEGLDVCKIIRKDSNVPIIMLTAKTTEEDKLAGLNLGADDYITKPFSPREVTARVKAVLRRIDLIENGETRVLVEGDLEIDEVKHEVKIRGVPIHLTPKEFKILWILASNPDRAFNREDLLERAFRKDYQGFERTVDVHIMNLRKKIEAIPESTTTIKTIYGVGYKFSEGNDAA